MVEVRKKLFGCESKATDPTIEVNEEGAEKIFYWTCPIKLIPKNIIDFMNMYYYYKNYQSAPMPDYNNVSKRFLLASAYYENRKSEMTKN